MAWIESHQGLEKHPKTLRLMSAMGWDLDQTLGKLHRFWWWCVDHAPDGDLRKFADDVLAAAVGLPMSDGEKFVEAMVMAGGRGNGNAPSGFLERKPYFRVHDWWGYFGPFLQVKYKKTPEKWKSIRDLYEDGCNNPPGNGGGNGSRNGEGNGEAGSPPPRTPPTPSSTQTETLTTLQDRGAAGTIVEIAVTRQTAQAQLLELFKAAYEHQLPTEQYKIDREDYIVAAHHEVRSAGGCRQSADPLHPVPGRVGLLHRRWFRSFQRQDVVEPLEPHHPHQEEGHIRRKSS